AASAKDHEPVSVSEVVRAAVAIVRPIAEEHRVTVRHGELTDEAWVTGDHTRLTEVMVNLLENSVRYNRTGGSVNVDVQTGNGEVAVSVRDTGVGIAPESIDLVFKRFWREDASRSTGGSGLGLSIVKRIVEAHDGRIEVTSTVGEGSCFTVRLPLNTTPPEAPAG
ncbi:MAG: HAMP domain-containing histidine kinase, partial [Nitrospirota bacterium]|nr:HAMP domain-containing histidine kinase [Nitrospirota bacterium]